MLYRYKEQQISRYCLERIQYCILFYLGSSCSPLTTKHEMANYIYTFAMFYRSIINIHISFLIKSFTMHRWIILQSIMLLFYNIVLNQKINVAHEFNLNYTSTLYLRYKLQSCCRQYV